MGKVIQNVRELGPAHITAAQLNSFAGLLASTPSADDRREAVAFFLRSAAPTPEQVVALSESDAVRNDLALLQLLKRHARSEEFRLSHESEADRLSKPWATAFELLRAVTGIVPTSNRRRVAP
jgi:hypothetical protein